MDHVSLKPKKLMFFNNDQAVMQINSWIYSGIFM